MVILLKSLLLSSVIGTLAWLIINIIKPFSKKILSESLHYYFSLVPIIFFLGGTEMLSILSKTLFEKMFKSTTVQSASKHIFTKTEQPHLSDIDIASISSFLIFIWLIGVLLFLIFKFLNYFRYKKKIFANCILFKYESVQAKMVKSQNVISPITMGIISPIIILPQVNIELGELDLMLVHEQIHLKRKDLIVKFIVMFANAIHWFNPFSYIINKDIANHCELSCDEILVKNMDKTKRVFYAKTILNSLERGVTYNSELLIGLCSSKAIIKERIELIMNNTSKNPKKIFSFSMLLFLFIAVSSSYVYAVGNKKITQSLNLNVSKIEYDESSYTNNIKRVEFDWEKEAENTMGRPNPDPAIADVRIPIVYPSVKRVEFDWEKEAENTMGRPNPDPAILDGSVPIIYPSNLE